MYLLLIGSVLFVAASINNVTQGKTVEAIGGFVIGGIMFGIRYYFKAENRKSQDFIKWLHSNENEINKGTAHFEGASLDLDTEITQFQACFSFLIFTLKVPSRFYVNGYHFTSIISLFYSLFTLIFGWWGLPWGPIYTVQTIMSNIAGGKMKTIRQLMLENSNKRQTEAKTI